MSYPMDARDTASIAHLLGEVERRRDQFLGSVRRPIQGGIDRKNRTSEIGWGITVAVLEM